MIQDTIAAVSTAIGEGAIGIIRVSGPDAMEIVDKVFKPRYAKDIKNWSSHTLHLGTVIHPDDGKAIDEVLVAWMKGPRTFTTEDVAEFHCHGGSLPLRETLEAILRAGARAAEPGEFTKRAFLGGRLDLAQAEAIMEVIQSKTRDGLGAALSQLEGHLSKKIKTIDEQLLQVMAHLEALIDFPEEDLPELSDEKLLSDLENIRTKLEELLRRAESGKVLREGWKTVIVGRPNVGKSSLLNALLDEQRAIVTDIPGTTRDAIEEMIDLGGIPLRIIDTAGIRETTDLVEKLGVEKTRQYMEQADLVLFVLDGLEEITEEEKELLQSLADRPAIILINKSDIKDRRLEEKDIYNLVKKPIISISAREAWGIEELAEKIRHLVFGDEAENKAILTSNERLDLITQARHREAIERALQHIRQMIDAVKLQTSADFLTIDLRAAWEALGEITGKTVGEDVMDKIFASFCIGK
ncbi:tRNA uridine-5-carboxymethylaminomethyl(34) synthesis GTPase MnmE [Heliorestis acidaminivorans]|uniref:tRNA modification GTPase MnmE n=1 Tax=Heliorestis acidaminivorans TaxID=553427 RepID=A0A6I0F511_9FIRM|nr:tRNA uridine-5-carboxymethylaminomethyl(34) synthesis GTPase MnmE [Heliorestis acidaminivorans]KAB2953922.1 tRNA uridine-5-carboxymethylaminomethyl(34) synthesis GTPase MnmE [Heliorestis acidaminivorans]